MFDQHINMRKLTLSIALVLCSFLLHAQKNYAVKVVDSKTENALANARVKIKTDKKGGKTNEYGTMVIMGSPGEVLMVSAAGYITQEVTLSVSAAVHVFLNKKKAKKRESRDSASIKKQNL